MGIKTRRRPDREISPEMWAIFSDAYDPTTATREARRAYVDWAYLWTAGRREAEWATYSEEVIAVWAEEHPGTRPSLWWRYDAPEPRRQLGGIGTPAFEALAYAPRYEYGLPVDWVSPFSVAYYNGRAVDIHGNAIGKEYREGGFPYKAIDPSDPPLYESQTAYLDRHGLLTDGERAQLAVEGWPEPEAITVDADRLRGLGCESATH